MMSMFFNSGTTDHVAILELHGEIGKNLSLDVAKSLIDETFRIDGLKAVLLEIDSPGGSSFETEQIYQYLKSKMNQTNIPVLSFVMEQALSGGYWLACAGLAIYASGKLSMVGSIGVIMEYLNYDDLLEEIGIEKRTITSGVNKDLMNSENGEKRLGVIAREIHDIFIKVVQESRGNRLTGDSEHLFNGDFWLATQAVELGIIDGIMTTMDFIEETFKEDTKVIRIKMQEPGFAEFMKGII